MKKNNILILLLIVITASGTFCQQPSLNTVELYPDKDATLYYSTHPNEPASANTNWGNYESLRGETWTKDSYIRYWRGLIEFNLDELPPFITIESAILTLYGIDHNKNSIGTWKDDNSCIMAQVIDESWDEHTVTWNNQPPVYPDANVLLPKSLYYNQNYDIDVTAFVQAWYNKEYENNGLLLKLINESIYRSLYFASSDYPNQDMHPKLVITFTGSTPVNDRKINAVELQFNSCSASDAYHNYNATRDFEYISCRQSYPPSGDVWFRFEAVSEEVRIILSPGSPGRTFMIALLDENNNELTCLQNHVLEYTNLVPGDNYYIVVDNDGGMSHQGHFGLCLFSEAGATMIISTGDGNWNDDIWSYDGANMIPGLRPTLEDNVLINGNQVIINSEALANKLLLGTSNLQFINGGSVKAANIVFGK